FGDYFRRMGGHASLATGGPRFFRGKLVRPTLTVGAPPALWPGLSRLLGSKLVSRAFTMGGDSSLAGDFSLLVFVHRRKSATFLLCHGVGNPPSGLYRFPT